MADSLVRWHDAKNDFPETGKTVLVAVHDFFDGEDGYHTCTGSFRKLHSFLKKEGGYAWDVVEDDYSTSLRGGFERYDDGSYAEVVAWAEFPVFSGGYSY